MAEEDSLAVLCNPKPAQDHSDDERTSFTYPAIVARDVATLRWKLKKEAFEPYGLVIVRIILNLRSFALYYIIVD
jgi:hypothetical protein